jgi:hypothetical protein
VLSVVGVLSVVSGVSVVEVLGTQINRLTRPSGLRTMISPGLTGSMNCKTRIVGTLQTAHLLPLGLPSKRIPHTRTCQLTMHS